MLEMKTTDTLKRQENFGNYIEITEVPATIMKTIVPTENGHSSPTFMEETKSNDVRCAIFTLTNYF